jgi:protocatechuate 3,4-dioxygenase beta subunit
MASTPALTEGPYYKANSPERASLLETGVTGVKLELSGYVLSTDCQPVAHAWLDFWQANGSGDYDNIGYILRGHQFTDAQGRYHLETIIPGLYPGRTEHIHVKVQAPGGPVLTTQLFFPGVADNEDDPIFDPNLVLPLQSTNDGEQATFNFIVSLH